MGDERQSVFTRAAGLKKAGLPTMAVVVLTIFSMPGFWEFFVDKSEDEAKDQAAQSEAKAEVAYEVLRAELDYQSRESDRLRDEVRDLRIFMRNYIVGDFGMGIGGMGVSSGIGYGIGAPTPMSDHLMGEDGADETVPISDIVGELVSPDELFGDGNGNGVPEALEEPEPVPQMIQQELPSSLDDLSLVERIKEKVKKK